MRFKCLIATQHVGSSAHGCFELELCAPRHDLILNIVDIDWFEPWSHAMIVPQLSTFEISSHSRRQMRSSTLRPFGLVDDTERAILSDRLGDPIEPLGARYSGWASPDDNTWNIPPCSAAEPPALACTAPFDGRHMRAHHSRFTAGWCGGRGVLARNPCCPRPPARSHAGPGCCC